MRRIKHILGVLFLVAVVGCYCGAMTAWASDEAPSNQESVESTVQSGGEGHSSVHQKMLTKKSLKNFFWRIVNFVVLLAILIYFGAKPIAEALTGRQKKIQSEIEDLEARRATAEKTYRDFEAKLAGMEKEIDSIVERAIAQAEVEKAKIIEKAEQTAADVQRQAEMAINNEMIEARRTLKNDIADQSAAMAEQLIMKNLTNDDQVKIIEDYLDKVGAVQ